MSQSTETTRLLPSPKTRHVENFPANHGLKGLDKSPSVKNELSLLIRSSSPLAAGLILEMTMNTINVLVVGRLSSKDLAVVGNASLLAGVTGWPFPLALAAAFTTLSAPLFPHQDQRPQISLHLQRTLVISMISAIPIAALWWNLEPVLLALGQPPSIAEGMRIYMRWMILAIPGLSLTEAMKAFLQVQGIMNAPPLVLVVLIPIHLLVCILLVHHTSLGAAGAAISSTITFWSSGLLLVVYAMFTRGRECWGGWDKRAFVGWWGVLKLAIPGAIMFGSEWWAFEIVALLAGRLGPAAVAAQAVISTLDNIVAMAPYAISIAIANRIGNLLGLGVTAIPRARRTLKAAFILELVVTCTFGAAVLIGRHKIAYLFTDDEEVAEMAASVAIFLASYQAFDGLQNVGAACLRAFGRQNIGSVIHIICYYILGLPFGTWLAFGKNGPHWGLKGLWAGQALSLGIIAAAELAVAAGVRWEGEVEKVRERGEEGDEDRETADEDGEA